MIAVTIHRPLRKNCVWLFSEEDTCVRLIVGFINNGAAIDLIRECGAGVQNGTGLLRFGCANRGTAAEARCAAKALAAIEIEQRHLMTEVGPARDGSAATAFGVAGMTACHDNLKRAGLGAEG